MDPQSSNKMVPISRRIITLSFKIMNGSVTSYFDMTRIIKETTGKNPYLVLKRIFPQTYISSNVWCLKRMSNMPVWATQSNDLIMSFSLVIWWMKTWWQFDEKCTRLPTLNYFMSLHNVVWSMEKETQIL